MGWARRGEGRCGRHRYGVGLVVLGAVLLGPSAAGAARARAADGMDGPRFEVGPAFALFPGRPGSWAPRADGGLPVPGGGMELGAGGHAGVGWRSTAGSLQVEMLVRGTLLVAVAEDSPARPRFEGAAAGLARVTLWPKAAVAPFALAGLGGWVRDGAQPTSGHPDWGGVRFDATAGLGLQVRPASCWALALSAEYHTAPAAVVLGLTASF